MFQIPQRFKDVDVSMVILWCFTIFGVSRVIQGFFEDISYITSGCTYRILKGGFKVVFQLYFKDVSKVFKVSFLMCLKYVSRVFLQFS